MDKKNIRKEVGKRVRIIRKAKKLTQEQVGERAELNYKYVGEVERGEVNPSIETLFAIAEALNVSLSQLFAENWQLPIDYQLPPKDIQMIKDVLPFLNRVFTGWKIKDIEAVRQALSSLNSLFLEEK